MRPKTRFIFTVVKRTIYIWPSISSVANSINFKLDHKKTFYIRQNWIRRSGFRNGSLMKKKIRIMMRYKKLKIYWLWHLFWYFFFDIFRHHLNIPHRYSSSRNKNRGQLELICKTELNFNIDYPPLLSHHILCM